VRFYEKINILDFLAILACGVGFGLFYGGCLACWRGVVVGVFTCYCLWWGGWWLTSIFLVELTETRQIWQIIF
jgi:hypothetical protein